MRIIIAGDGETGTHLANMLSVENQDIVLMGNNREHLAELDAYGNYITFEGTPLSMENLKACGAEGADLFVAVTPDERENILACLLAKEAGAVRCAARVDNREFADGIAAVMLRRYGVDYTIWPEKGAAEDIARFIDHNWVSEWMSVHQGELYVIGVKMGPGSLISGRRLCDIASSPRLYHVSAIKRGGEIIIPRGDDMIMDGDTVYFSVLPKYVDIVREACGKTETGTRNIMIAGAGRVSESLLSEIARSHNVTVIEPDRARCGVIASRFADVVVVNAAVNDVVTLREEGIGNCDVFLSLSGSSETNIVACMVAREHGVAKTVARIEELQYVPEAESLSIDKIVNKKRLNAAIVLNLLLDSEGASAQCLSLDNAEISCLTASEGSAITRSRVADLPLPRGLTVGGLIRDGKASLVEGRTVIEPGDRVVVLFKAGVLGAVKRLFR